MSGPDALAFGSMRNKHALLLIAMASSLVAAVWAAEPQAPPLPTAKVRARVALTFDDLPVHGAIPPGTTRLEAIRRITQALAAVAAPPAVGFINAKTMDDAPENREILAAWRAAGHSLANHTFSHMDLNTNSLEDFERDVLANEPTLRQYMGSAEWHWFRFPYLHAGATREKRDAVAAQLRTHGYRLAEVTLNFDDWAFHDPYARCVAKGDEKAIAWLEDAYLRRATLALEIGPETARIAFGRDIPHVLLLHAGGLNAVMMPALLKLLRDRGFELVSLEEAEADDAYAVAPDVVLAEGGTLVDQKLDSLNLPRPRAMEPSIAEIGALCR